MEQVHNDSNKAADAQTRLSCSQTGSALVEELRNGKCDADAHLLGHTGGSWVAPVVDHLLVTSFVK